MNAHPHSFIVRHRAVTRNTRRSIGLSLAIATAMTGLSLLIGGCDATTPSAPTAFAAGVTSASMSVGVAANVAPSDSAAVAAVSTAWDAAWNTANPAGIAALFLENSEIVNGRGQLVIGAAAIRANHAAAFASVFKGSRSRGIVRRIVFLSDAAAVLDVDNEVTGFTSLPGGAVPTQPGLNLQRHKRVLVKRNGQWRTALMQLTTVAPGAVPPPAP